MTAWSPTSIHDGRDVRPHAAEPAAERRPRRRLSWRSRIIVSSLLAVAAVVLLRGAGIKTALFRQLAPAYAPLEHPTVTASRPNGEEASVPCDAFIAADVQLPNTGHVIDQKTVNSGSV